MDPSLYDISYNYHKSEITFALLNGMRTQTGFQIYRPLQPNKRLCNDPISGRYFTYLPHRTMGVFGIETLNAAKKELFIVEGIFKAATLHRLGYNAVAVLSNAPKQLVSWFKIMRSMYDVVAIGDNDSAGQTLVKVVGRGYCSTKDIDEMLDEEVINMINAGLAQWYRAAVC